MNLFRSCLVVFSAATFFLFSFINLNSFNALNDLLRDFYHADALTLSNLSAMYFYANIIFMIPAGLLLDRFSIRKLLIIFMLLSVLASVLFTWSDHLYLAMLARFIIGGCSTFCLLSTAKLTSRWFPPNHCALVMGLVVTMAMLGGAIAQQLPALINVTHSWQSAMSLISILGLLFWLCILLFVKDYPKTYQDAHLFQKELSDLKTQGFFKPLGQAVFNLQTWLAGIYSNLLTLPIIILGALWGKNYLMTVQHETMEQAALSISFIFLGTLIGCPLAGAISDKLRRRKMPMLVGAFLTLLMALILLTERTLSPLETSFIFFLMGLFSGSQIITFALVIESNPKNITALSESIAAMIIMSAGAIFQPLFAYFLELNWDGKVSQNHGAIYSINDFHTAFLLLPIAFGFSVLLSFFIKETYCRSKH